MSQSDKQKSSDRNGKVTFSTLIDPEKYRSLRLLSVQTDTEIKKLIDEALSLLFTKHAENIPSLPRRN
jgi:hypothetical protein